MHTALSPEVRASSPNYSCRNLATCSVAGFAFSSSLLRIRLYRCGQSHVARTLRMKTYSSRRSTRNLPRRRNNSTELPSRKPGIRDPSSEVPAAWEEVLAGNPSESRINILFSCLHRIRNILVVEGGNTGPVGGHIVPEVVRIVGLEEGRSNYNNAVSGYTIGAAS